MTINILFGVTREREKVVDLIVSGGVKRLNQMLDIGKDQGGKAGRPVFALFCHF